MRSLIKALLRIMAIWIAIETLRDAVNAVASIVNMWRYERSYAYITLGDYSVLFAIGVLAALFLWLKADRIAKAISGDTDDSTPPAIISSEHMLKSLMALLGIYLIATSLPNLAGTVEYHVSFSNPNTYPDIQSATYSANEVARLTSEIATILIGVLLLVGGKPIIRVLGNFWSSGRLTGEAEQKQ